MWIELHRLLYLANYKTVCFIVDALDEYGEESVQSFLVLLIIELIPQLLSQSEGSPCEIKWIPLSRNEVAIREHLRASAYTSEIDLEMNTEAVGHSVDQYIEMKVEELAHLKKY